MILNKQALLTAAPIVNMLDHKAVSNGVSHGLTEAGYDIRIKQNIWFSGSEYYTGRSEPLRPEGQVDGDHFPGKFTLASAIEEFDMPDFMVGVVHDKSTWARRGLSVFNTVIEPGWKGFLTLELVYHGTEELYIPAGAGIAQVLFHQTSEQATYNGKYQNQADRPVEAIYEKG